nr:leucine-rich repeat receptor-like protein kinase pxc2 [Quercus suber]
MTMIMGVRSFKLPPAFLTLFVLVHLRLALGGVIPGVGVANNISCPEGERQALLEFKKGISDPDGWLSSWGSEDGKKNCCNWQGIRCSNQTGHVVQLQFYFLGGNNLNGQLIEHINDLFGCIKDSLVVLSLAENQLWGSLPDFAMFPSLKEIYLSSNKLNGTMPKTIGNLHNLEHLDVSLNYLQGVISEAHFSNLSKLLSLDLSGNSLTLEFDFNWVPPFQLDELYLRSCKLGPRFPNWIRTQRNVTILDISNAQISDTVPAEWFLGHMQFFDSKAVMETCLFLIIGQHEGLAIRNNGGEQGKILEDVSEAEVTTFNVRLTKK